MAETEQWRPAQEAFSQTINLLSVLRDPTNSQYAEAQRHLETHQGDAQFLLCLAYVLAGTTREQVPDHVRQLAGLLLKNYVLRHTKEFVQDTEMSASTASAGVPSGVAPITAIAQIRAYVKLQALVAARDANKSVRNTAGILITTLATHTLRAGVPLGVAWPELFPALLAMLGSEQAPAIEGAFSSLVKILEDCGQELRADTSGYGPEVLNQLVPILSSFFRAEVPGIRATAVRAMNLLVPLKPAQLLVHMDAFIQALAGLQDDPSPRVRQGVCQTLVALFREASDHLLSRLGEVMEFMLAKSQDQDEDVAREACEFWSVFCHYYGNEGQQQVPEALRAFLPRLVPVLLAGMVFAQADRDAMEADKASMLDSVPDRAEDLRPVHYQSRGDRGFGADVLLPTLLPYLYAKLQQGSVWEREACILALGAVASCMEGMGEQLLQLFPFLLQQLDDKAGMATNPQLGCTVAWTLGRYAGWILEQHNDSGFLAPLVERLLGAMLDPHKKVQQAACSALASLEEDAGLRLLPYLSHLLGFMSQALGRYQTRSLIVLFDTLGTLADAVKHELAAPEYTALFMPALWAKWAAVADSDRVLLYLMECMTSLAVALGPAFQPWASEAFARCLRLLQQVLAADSSGQACDKEFAVCALDLLTGMAEGLGSSLESLLLDSNLMGVLFACMQDASEDVRQSAFALLGDLVKACHLHLVPVLPTYLPVLVNNLDPRAVSVCNNASWALGELTVRVGPEHMTPHVPGVMARLIPMARQRNEMHPHLVENTAITIGRLAKICPNAVATAPGVGADFVLAWCLSLQEIKHRGEKEHAFEGLCLLLQQKPSILLQPSQNSTATPAASPPSVAPTGADTFEAFAWAVASWYDADQGRPDVPAGLQHMFQVIFNYVRETVNNMPAQDWNEYLSSLDPQLVSYLVSFYEM
ncbi:transportin-1 isoform 1 [Nannochloropsis gaditana]|uniref:Transportin-1 isoform 1 n=1 Tax=Nannochloropsis gaditana TaxID=72520 RepID=W7TNT6_9STRA|nr:transportin-1 isoform 1 [Nannochloropsis gaditana]